MRRRAQKLNARRTRRRAAPASQRDLERVRQAVTLQESAARRVTSPQVRHMVAGGAKRQRCRRLLIALGSAIIRLPSAKQPAAAIGRRCKRRLRLGRLAPRIGIVVLLDVITSSILITAGIRISILTADLTLVKAPRLTSRTKGHIARAVREVTPARKRIVLDHLVPRRRRKLSARRRLFELRLLHRCVDGAATAQGLRRRASQ